MNTAHRIFAEARPQHPRGRTRGRCGPARLARAFCGRALGKAIGVGLIVFYQKCFSRLKPPCCRFLPTCSVYAREAIERHGFFRGGWLAVRRLLRCHPFYRGPVYDPVPPPRPER